MTEVEIEEVKEAVPVVRHRPLELLVAGGAGTLALFAIFGAAVLLFAFRTVHSRPEQQLHADPGATRSYSVITYWAEHGYFRSGGLLSFDTHLAGPGSPPRVFYRSSSGAYMVPGYIVEKIAMKVTGQYRWKLLAITNEIVMLVSGALLGLLVFRLLTEAGIVARDALLLAVATQAVFATFPETLWQYWEIGAQASCLPFAFLFLLLERPQSRGARLGQAVAAFFLVYIESVFGVFFLASYCVYALLVDKRRHAAIAVAMKTALPALAALLLFTAQIKWVQAHDPDVPMQGSEFMFRTGLDGSTQYYGDHLDIIYGRNVARRNFPVNRESLFNWSVLFVCGVLATAVAAAASSRSDRFRHFLMPMVSLIGGYALYGALFSQALVIHPYLYDILIATPLMIALFAFVPALAETRFRSGGVVVAVTLFAAAWYSMVQMRHYAMWYPVPPPVKAQTHLTTHADRLRA